VHTRTYNDPGIKWLLILTIFCLRRIAQTPLNRIRQASGNATLHGSLNTPDFEILVNIFVATSWY
jgi:hypothetical protein